ncbi:MAG: hypothetical protein KatS3mg009_1011 [Acidimicrobiia bacterium]|nr:MAG: hypothetical protein KatS3mg009_1011 [Acidimicrobiia bacterium]
MTDPRPDAYTDGTGAPDGAPGGFYGLLERSLFPRIIGWTIHPLHILALLFLWIALLVFHRTGFELVGGNYTNGLSAMAASIVLLQQTRHHREVRRLHERHDRLLHQLHELVTRGGGDAPS